MASGKFDLSKTLGTSSYIYSRCEWSSSGNVSTNKSSISVKVIVGKRSGSNTPTTCTFNTSVSVSGANNPATKSSSPYYSVNANEEITVFSDSFVIEHNSDGTKSTTISVTIGNNNVYHAAGADSITLDTIPRASSVSGGSGNIGETTTININRASDTFIHTLSYSFGSLTGTIATGVGTSYNWTIPTSFYAQIPNTNSGTGTITCKTYDGSTLIGTSTVSFTAKVTNSNPTVGAFTYKDSNSTTTAITEDNQRIIRNNSNLIFAVGTAIAKNSATISKYEITFNEITKSRTSAGNIDFGTINLSYNETATLKVTDSRGNTTIKEITVIIDDWVLPTALISLNRKNNFYSETIIKVDATYSNLNDKNSIIIQCQYKKVSDTEYSELQSLSDNIKSILNLDNNYQWNVKVIVNDRIGFTVYNLFVDKGMPIAYFDRLKNSVGINTFPTDNEEFAINGRLTVNNQDVTASDTLPIGAIVEYDGETIPEGYEEYENVLYDNEDGSTGNITLSDSASNYEYIEIYFGRTYADGVNCYDYTKVYKPNGKMVDLHMAWRISGGYLQIQVQNVVISETNIIRDTETHLNLVSGGSSSGGDQTELKIYRVVGYK